MMRPATLLLLSLLALPLVAMEPDTNRRLSDPPSDCYTSKNRRKKYKKKAHQNTTLSRTNTTLSLKSLTNDHGSRVTYALYTLNKTRRLPKEEHWVSRLGTAERHTLLNTLSHPLQIAHAAEIFLPPEMTSRIAYFIYSSLAALRYKSLKASHNQSLKNASIVHFNPYNEKQTLFTQDNNIKLLNYEEVKEVTRLAPEHTSHISKMIYHPTEQNQIIAKQNNYLTIYKDGLMDQWNGLSIINFTLLPNNNTQLASQLLVHTKDNENYVFDLTERRYLHTLKNPLTTSSNTTEIVPDPHHQGLVADLTDGYIRIFDMKTRNMTSITTINRNHGKFLFDPHHADIVAYVSGKCLRIVDLKAQRQCACLTHNSPIIDFDFNPHVPYELLVTQKNGTTITWKPQSIEGHTITLDQVTHYLRTGEMA